MSEKLTASEAQEMAGDMPGLASGICGAALTDPSHGVHSLSISSLVTSSL